MPIVEVILDVLLSEMYKGTLNSLHTFLIISYWFSKTPLDKINSGGSTDNIRLSSETKSSFDKVSK
nr:hypothetical protein [Mycoplasmopsis bovis]